MEVTATRGSGISIRSGIKGLTVLKSTASAFHGFYRDEFTSLKETWDRVLSTDIDAVWEWRLFDDLADVKRDIARFTKAWEDARTVTLRVFANDHSESVQATMYKMADLILGMVKDVNHVEYALPNKHYFEIGEKPQDWHYFLS